MAFPWRELKLPVLNVTGRCDRVFLDREVVDRVLAAMPGVRRLDWQDCGHLVPLERPERMAEALGEFGAELERRARRVRPLLQRGRAAYIHRCKPDSGGGQPDRP